MVLPLLLTSSFITARADGFYISASGGVNWTDAAKADFFGDDLEFHEIRYNPNTGLSFAGAVGYEGFFSDAMGFRAEAQGFYNDNNIGSSSLKLDDVGFADLDGDQRAFGVMGNFYLTFGGRDARVTPFVGLGAGFMNIDPDIKHPLAVVGGHDNVFAYQAIAGLEMPLGSNWRASTEVRFIDSGNGDFVINTGLEDIPLKMDYSSTTVLVTFRYLMNPN